MLSSTIAWLTAQPQLTHSHTNNLCRNCEPTALIEMELSECVLSAGRAVLDMVEREWQPLSPGELELRLDQAVEEILEADLLARVTSHPQPPSPVYVQLMQTRANVESPTVPTQTTTNSPAKGDATETQEPLEDVDSAAVKVRNPE